MSAALVLLATQNADKGILDPPTIARRVALMRALANHVAMHAPTVPVAVATVPYALFRDKASAVYSHVHQALSLGMHVSLDWVLGADTLAACVIPSTMLEFLSSRPSWTTFSHPRTRACSLRTGPSSSRPVGLTASALLLRGQRPWGKYSVVRLAVCEAVT